MEMINMFQFCLYGLLFFSTEIWARGKDSRRQMHLVYVDVMPNARPINIQRKQVVAQCIISCQVRKECWAIVFKYSFCRLYSETYSENEESWLESEKNDFKYVNGGNFHRAPGFKYYELEKPEGKFPTGNSPEVKKENEKPFGTTGGRTINRHMTRHPSKRVTTTTTLGTTTESSTIVVPTIKTAALTVKRYPMTGRKTYITKSTVPSTTTTATTMITTTTTTDLPTTLQTSTARSTARKTIPLIRRITSAKKGIDPTTATPSSITTIPSPTKPIIHQLTTTTPFPTKTTIRPSTRPITSSTLPSTATTFSTTTIRPTTTTTLPTTSTMTIAVRPPATTNTFTPNPVTSTTTARPVTTLPKTTTTKTTTTPATPTTTARPVTTLPKTTTTKTTTKTTRETTRTPPLRTPSTSITTFLPSTTNATNLPPSVPTLASIRVLPTISKIAITNPPPVIANSTTSPQNAEVGSSTILPILTILKAIETAKKETLTLSTTKPTSGSTATSKSTSKKIVTPTSIHTTSISSIETPIPETASPIYHLRANLVENPVSDYPSDIRSVIVDTEESLSTVIPLRNEIESDTIPYLEVRENQQTPSTNLEGEVEHPLPQVPWEVN